MKNWRCTKAINMDEDLYVFIAKHIPHGLQSKVLGAIIEDWVKKHTEAGDFNHAVAEILVLTYASLQRNDDVKPSESEAEPA